MPERFAIGIQLFFMYSLGVALCDVVVNSPLVAFTQFGITKKLLHQL